MKEVLKRQCLYQILIPVMMTRRKSLHWMLYSRTSSTSIAFLWTATGAHFQGTWKESITMSYPKISGRSFSLVMSKTPDICPSLRPAEGEDWRTERLVSLLFTNNRFVVIFGSIFTSGMHRTNHDLYTRVFKETLYFPCCQSEFSFPGIVIIPPSCWRVNIYSFISHYDIHSRFCVDVFWRLYYRVPLAPLSVHSKEVELASSSSKLASLPLGSTTTTLKNPPSSTTTALKNPPGSSTSDLVSVYGKISVEDYLKYDLPPTKGRLSTSKNP